MKHLGSVLSGLIGPCFALLLLFAVPAAAQMRLLQEAVPRGAAGHARIQPTHSTAFGHSLEDWAAIGGEWMWEIPVPQNPMLTSDGADLCTWPQSDKAWFIAAQFCLDATCEQPKNYFCRVPAGKAVLYPFAGNSGIDAYPGTLTDDELRAAAAYWTDMLRDLSAEVDGVPVTDLEGRRVVTPVYLAGPLPADNVFALLGYDAPAGSTFRVVDDIYTLLVPPLPLGPHTLHVSGRFEGLFAFEATVHLEVVTGGQGKEAGIAAASESQESATATDAAALRTSWGRIKVIYR